MANETANLKLKLTPRDETQKSFQEFRMELAGTEESNMTIIDAEIGALKAVLANGITWGMLKDGFFAKTDETE